MGRFTISFHNHLPAAWDRRRGEFSLRVGKRLLQNAFRAGIDVLCINQWATVPGPFLLFEALAGGRLARHFVAEDHGTHMLLRQSGSEMVLVKGLEIGVATPHKVESEVILLGVDADFPVEEGELPCFDASRTQKARLWDEVCRYAASRPYWLLVAPHPCFSDGLGLSVAAELIQDGPIHTYEAHNSMVERFDPAANRSCKALETLLADANGRFFSGITGNDGVDPTTLTLSTTQVTLESRPNSSAELLEKLAEKVQQGDVMNTCGRATLLHLFWKFLNSSKKGARFRSRLASSARSPAAGF